MKYIVIVAIIAIFAFMLNRSSANKAQALENKRLADNFLSENKNNEGVVETSSGLQYKIVTHGDGTQQPTNTDKVKVHYHGTLLDGTVFDSSVERQTPISFNLNQVIKGWTQGLQLMTVGDKTTLYIPSSLAYGDRSAGKIPAGSLLIFDVELLAIH